MSQDEKKEPPEIQVLDDKELNNISGGLFVRFPKDEDEDT